MGLAQSPWGEPMSGLNLFHIFFLCFTSSCTSEDLIPNPRKPSNYLIPSSSVDPHLFSFFPSSIRLWNSIPHQLKSKPTLSSFKASLDKITLSSTYQQVQTSQNCIYLHILFVPTTHLFGLKQNSKTQTNELKLQYVDSRTPQADKHTQV